MYDIRTYFVAKVRFFRESTKYSAKFFAKLLLFQTERVLDTVHFVLEGLVNLQTLLDGRTTMNDGAVVAASNELSDAACRHLGIFLCEIHRHLTDNDIVTLARTAENILLLNTIVMANLLHDIINSERFVVYLDSTLDDTLGQTQVDIGVVDNGIGQQRIDDTFKVAHGTIGGLGNILDDVVGNLQSVATAFGIEDVLAQLYVRLFELGNEAAGETCQQAVLHTQQIDRRTVRGEDYLLAQAEQMVENVEERVKGLRGSSPLLDIIHDEHIDALVEADEVVHRIPTGGIGKLHLEQTGRDIKYAPAWVHLFTTHANGIDEVRLATSRGSIDKEGVEGRLARMLSNGHADSARQLVGITLDETLEGLVQEIGRAHV